MLAWLGIKAALNWQRRDSKNDENKEEDLRKIILASQLSMFASLVSVLFALIGGLTIGIAVSPSLPVKLLH